MALLAANTKPGLQASQTTGVIATIYSHGDDPHLRQLPGGKLELVGRRNYGNDQLAITSCTIGKSLGATGNWQLTLKAPDARRDAIDYVVDDDWIDITFTINGVKHHTLRGQVDNIRRVDSTDGNGAPSRTYFLTGRDFGRLFEITPLWFNEFNAELADVESLKAFRAKGISGNPAQTVQAILFSFFNSLAASGRANWQMPPSMPNGGNLVSSDGRALDAIDFSDNDFDPEPARDGTIYNPGGAMLWPWAQEWSDPGFCELWCDLGKDEPLTAGYLLPNESYDVPDTRMHVFFRNRPFPTTTLGRDSLWYRLPEVVIPDQWMTNKDVGRGGAERFTMFTVSPGVAHEAGQPNLYAPLASLDDISRHGVRQYNIETRYIAYENAIGNLATRQRQDVVDWYGLNPYLLSGSVNLASLFPNIRVGMRMLVPGSPAYEERYYVEQVSHQWSVSAGGSTSLGVTRGWIGSEESYIASMRKMSARYKALEQE